MASSRPVAVARPPSDLETPDALLQAPGYLARRLYQAYSAVWVRTVDPTLTGPQFAVLVAIDAHPEADQGSLAAAVSLDRSTMADVARRMEERGLIVRVVDAHDARRKILSLTQRGVRTLRILDQRARDLDQRLLAGMTASEADAAVKLLQQLSDNWVELGSD